MLHHFRNRGITSVIYGVMIVAMSVGLVAYLVPKTGNSSGGSLKALKEVCAARVGGTCIEPQSFKSVYRILMPRDQSGNLQTERAQSMGLSKIVLDGMVERELLIQYGAQHLHLTATEDEVTDELFNGFIHVSVPSDNPQLAASLRVPPDGRISAGFKDRKTKQFSMKVYEQTIKSLGRSVIEFHEDQKREILAGKVRDVVRTPIRVSEPEAFEMYVAEKSSAKVSYVEVKQKFLARYASAASQTDIDEWMKDKTNEALVTSTTTERLKDAEPVENHIRHILVKVPEKAAADDHALAIGKLSQAVARVKAGESFAEISRGMSDDTGSAAKGGDVGDKTDGFVTEFKKAADELKPGEMTTELIQTQFGYHLIMKDDPAKKDAVAAAVKRNVARELYGKTKAAEATKSLADAIAKDIKGGKSPEDAIKAAIAPFVKPGAKILAAPVRAMEKAESPAAAGAPTGDAGAPLHADAGAPPALPGKTTKTAKKAEKPVFAKIMTADIDPDRPQLVTSGSFNKGGDPIESLGTEGTAGVLKFAFSAKDGELMREPVRGDDGFFVVSLKEHKSATTEEFEKDKATYMQTLLAAKQAEAMALYVRRLREAHKGDISIDQSYVTDKSKSGPKPADDPEEQ